MTYLQLVKRLHQECGIAGDPPTDVTGHRPSSEPQRLCDWIANAWVAIQLHRPDWKFMKRSVSFQTTNGQGVYTPAQTTLPANSLGQWVLSTFTAYHTVSGFSSERPLEEIDYDEWEATYNFGSNRTSYGQPVCIGEHPEHHGLVLGPIPLGGYTIRGRYYLAPVVLSAAGDVPALPERHDPLGIVWKAMLDEGGFSAASEIYQRANERYATFMNLLERDELPLMGF